LVDPFKAGRSACDAAIARRPLRAVVAGIRRELESREEYPPLRCVAKFTVTHVWLVARAEALGKSRVLAWPPRWAGPG